MSFFYSARLIIISLLILPFLGIPPLRFGYYMQVEGIIAAFWFLGGLSGLWVLRFCLMKPRVAQRIWALPIVWGGLPIILFSIILSVINPIPLQVWTGFGQLGEGIFTFASQMFITFILCIMIRFKQIKTKIFWGTFISGNILSLLTIIGSGESPILSMRYWTWAPIFFPDFIGYIVAAFMGLYFMFIKKYKHHLFYHGLVLSSIMLLSYYSSNRSVYYATLCAMVMMGILYIRLPLFNHIGYQKRFASLFISMMISLTLFIVFYDVISNYLPNFMNKDISLIGRSYLTKMTFIDLIHRPFDWHAILSILIGNGWGDYGNALLGNVFLFNDIHLFNGENWKPSWEFVDRDMLHSHNMMMEHYLATGIIGVSLFLWIKYKTILSLKWHDRYAGVIYLTVSSIISLFWFPVIHTLPYLMVANAMVFMKPLPIRFLNLKYIKFFTYVMTPFMIVFSLVHVGFILLQAHDSKNNIDGNTLKRIDTFTDSPAHHYEALIGGRRWVAYMRSITRSSVKSISEKKDIEVVPYAERSLKMAQQLFHGIPHRGNYYSVLLPMNIYNELANHQKTGQWFEQNPENLKQWNIIADEYIKILPFRSDVLIPFLNYLLMHQQNDKMLHFLDALFVVSPQDPVGLWFKGMFILMDGHDRDKGICYLKKALDAKVTRYMPIPSTEIQRIQDTITICPKE